jgi:hypothetical protein
LVEFFICSDPALTFSKNSSKSHISIMVRSGI